MKRIVVVVALVCLSPLVALIATSPAEAAGPDSWAFVWDKDQTKSTSGVVGMTFPYMMKCPESFHARVAWIKWKYSSPAGSSVNIKWTAWRIKPNHNLWIKIEGQRKKFPHDKYTTRRFYDVASVGGTGPVDWDGSNSVGLFVSEHATTYAPNVRGVAGACQHPFTLAGLKKQF